MDVSSGLSCSMMQRGLFPSSTRKLIAINCPVIVTQIRKIQAPQTPLAERQRNLREIHHFRGCRRNPSGNLLKTGQRSQFDDRLMLGTEPEFTANLPSHHARCDPPSRFLSPIRHRITSASVIRAQLTSAALQFPFKVAVDLSAAR